MIYFTKKKRKENEDMSVAIETDKQPDSPSDQAQF